MEHKRAICRKVCLFAIALAFVAGFTPFSRHATIAAFATFLALASGWMWMTSPDPLRNDVPDALVGYSPFFERNGFCFVPQLNVRDGLCWFDVYFQTRWSGNCQAELYFIPMEGMSSDGNHQVQPISVKIECAGGEVGVVKIPYPIGESWQGKIMIYDVAARTTYPDGKGDILRGREGTPVGEPSSDLREALKAAKILIAPMRMTKDAIVEFQLPIGVQSANPPDAIIQTEMLWRPTYGFPVEQSS